MSLLPGQCVLLRLVPRFAGFHGGRLTRGAADATRPEIEVADGVPER